MWRPSRGVSRGRSAAAQGESLGLSRSVLVQTASRMRPCRRSSTRPLASKARPHAAPNPTAASAQLKPALLTTVTWGGRTTVGGLGAGGLTTSQYWWHVVGAMCTGRAALGRPGLRGPKRPAVAAGTAQAAMTRAIARLVRIWRARMGIGSPFLLTSRAEPCASPVARRLFVVDPGLLGVSPYPR